MLRLAAVLGGALLVGILVTLVLVLVELRDTNGALRDTRDRVASTERRVAAVDPLTAPGARKRITALAGGLERTTDAVPDIAVAVRRTLAATAAVARDVRFADLPAALGSLQAADLPAAIDDALGALSGARTVLADVAAPAPGDRACLRQLRVAAPLASGQLGCALLMLPELRAVLASQRRINAGTLATQQATLDAFRESLALQRQLLVHTRSIDAKLGGTVAPPAAP